MTSTPDHPVKAASAGRIRRDCTDEIKIIACAIALRAAGTVYAFHVRLSTELEAKARAQGPRCTDYLRRRFVWHLKRALGPDVLCWFCFECDEAGRLHLHGQLGVEDQNRLLAREALKRAAGEWKGPGSQFQVRMLPQDRNPDLRSAGYAAKNVFKARIRGMMSRFDSPRLWSPGFHGRAFAATNKTKTRAKEELAAIASDTTLLR